MDDLLIKKRSPDEREGVETKLWQGNLWTIIPCNYNFVLIYQDLAVASFVAQTL